MFNVSWFFKGLQVVGIVSAWSEKALADRKVTIQEAADLAKALCPVLGVKDSIELPGQLPNTEKLEPDKEVESEEAAPLEDAPIPVY